jgi:hypothetical protein
MEIRTPELEFSDKLAALIYLNYRDRIRRLQNGLENSHPHLVYSDLGFPIGFALLSAFGDWEEYQLTEEFWESAEPLILEYALNAPESPWAFEIEALLDHPVDETPLVRLDYEVANCFAQTLTSEDEYETEEEYEKAIKDKALVFVTAFKNTLTGRTNGRA